MSKIVDYLISPIVLAYDLYTLRQVEGELRKPAAERDLVGPLESEKDMIRNISVSARRASRRLPVSDSLRERSVGRVRSREEEVMSALEKALSQERSS